MIASVDAGKRDAIVATRIGEDIMMKEDVGVSKKVEGRDLDYLKEYHPA